MNKFLVAAVLMAASTAAMADGYRGGHRGYDHHGRGDNDAAVFVGGMIVGAVINEATQPRVVIQQQPQVIVQQPPVVVQQPQVIYQQPGYQSPVAPGQPYVIVNGLQPYTRFTSPGYDANGAAYCAPGQVLVQRLTPSGNVSNLGCAY